MLTRKQYELLVYINDYLKTRGVSPSFEEMKAALSLRSKSGIHRLITGLEERGFIRHLPHRARALEVLKLPENAEASAGSAARGAFAPKVIRGNFKPSAARAARPEVGAVELPLYGLIAAARRSIPCATNNTTSTCRPRCWAAGYTTRLTTTRSMLDAGSRTRGGGGDTVVIHRGKTPPRRYNRRGPGRQSRCSQAYAKAGRRADLKQRWRRQKK
jgi:repressor LexA